MRRCSFLVSRVLNGFMLESDAPSSGNNLSFLQSSAPAGVRSSIRIGVRGDDFEMDVGQVQNQPASVALTLSSISVRGRICPLGFCRAIRKHYDAPADRARGPSAPRLPRGISRSSGEVRWWKCSVAETLPSWRNSAKANRCNAHQSSSIAKESSATVDLQMRSNSRDRARLYARAFGVRIGVDCRTCRTD
jgi:hypothetical protein